MLENANHTKRHNQLNQSREICKVGNCGSEGFLQNLGRSLAYATSTVLLL